MKDYTECPECGSDKVAKSTKRVKAHEYIIYSYHCNDCNLEFEGKIYISE